MSKAIFVGGTGSNVGKSWIATALCRLMNQRGIRVVPFKAQNMSNNSFPCPGGGEIGRSQITQAEACGLIPEAAMNPVLLKPMGDSTSQVILHGKPWKIIHAKDYYEHSSFLQAESLKAYESLASRFDAVVLEGAGSVAEINLWDRDFTNLSMAKAVNARCLLVANIEQGGVFASVLGTLQLLPPEYRSLIAAFAINRFRGDRSLFAEGQKILEERSGIPCLGVLPYSSDIHIHDEDSLSLHSPRRILSVDKTKPEIAIIRFPRISNTTDFRLINHADWLVHPEAKQYAHIILPGTKSTIADFMWLQKTGLADWILEQHRNGASILGICGGYQMLGENITDENGVDGKPGSVAGLGLLPVQTTMSAEKITRVRHARTVSGVHFDSYEIHMGKTESTEQTKPFAILDDSSNEGTVKGRIAGTYLHGALESEAMIAELFGYQLHPQSQSTENYDALAQWLETNSSPAILEQLLSN